MYDAHYVRLRRAVDETNGDDPGLLILSRLLFILALVRSLKRA